MTKLTRKKLKVFGANGDESDFGVFGSQSAGDPRKTKDIEQIQSLSAWEGGLASALITGNHAPFMQDMNSLLHVLSYQQAYQLQEGIVEYDAGTTYCQNSIVKKPGTLELYASLIDNNVGNPLPSQADNTSWKFLTLWNDQPFRTGLDGAKAASPSAGNWYLSTDKGTLWNCLASGEWEDHHAGYYRKNVIMNSMMDIWQRGAGFAAIGDGKYSADRIRYNKGGGITAVHSITREFDAPASLPGASSLKLRCTTVDTSVTNGKYCGLQYTVEGYDFRRFVGQKATFSFWVKSNRTGTYCVTFRNSGGDRAYVAEYAILQANVWERKVVTVPFNYSGGTWNYVYGAGLVIYLTIAAGSVYQTPANTWANGNFICSPNQVNGCDATENVFYLTGMQLEVGSKATALEPVDCADDLARCLRYYETHIWTELSSTQSNWYLNGIGIPFRTVKRATPTVLLRSTQNAGVGGIAEYNSAGIWLRDLSAINIGASQYGYTVATNGLFGSNVYYSWSMAAEADF